MAVFSGRLLSHLRPYLPLLALGFTAEAVYVFYFLRRFSLLENYPGPYQDMGQLTNHSHAAFWAFLAAFAILFVLVGLGVVESRLRNDRTALGIVLGFGALFGLTMTFVYPITALDIFAYVDYSLVLTQYHQNPLFVPPAAIAHDPLMAMADGWAGTPAPYGPIGVVVTAIPTMFVGRNVLANLILMKLVFSTMTVATAAVVYVLLRLRYPRWALAGAVLVAWNPLILFESSANGHNDIVMVLFVALALLSMERNELTLGPILLTLSALTKFASAPLIPLFLIYGIARQPNWRERARYLVLTGGLMLLIAAACYAPFWRGTDTISNSIQFQNGRYLYSFSSVLANLFLGSISLPAAALVGRVLFVPVYLYGVWVASRSMEGLLYGSFLVVFVFLALANTSFLYWYAVLPLVLAAAVPDPFVRLAGVVMAAGVELAAALNVFVWVWVGVTGDTFRPINNVSYLAIFVLPAAILTGGMVRYRRLPGPGRIFSRRSVEGLL